MPHNQTNTPLVCNQVGNWFYKILRKSTIRDLPDFDCAVFRSAGYQVVIMRTPLDVQHGSLVTDDEWCLAVDTANLTSETNEFTYILQSAKNHTVIGHKISEHTKLVNTQTQSNWLSNGGKFVHTNSPKFC